jgi:hypothetical protein
MHVAPQILVAPGRLQEIFDLSHAAWEARDPDRIVALCAHDATFWMHDGTPQVKGRQALRRHYAALFERFPKMEWEIHRTELGHAHWMFDYTLVLEFTGAAPVTARVKMIDVVNVNEAGEVTRKDVYLNGAEAQAAYQAAGMKV